MSHFDRLSQVYKTHRLQALAIADAADMHPDIDLDSVQSIAMSSVSKDNPNRHADGSGRFSTTANSRVSRGARNPKSPHYTPYHLVRDPEPNPKNNYRVHHGDKPLTDSMPRSQAANEYAKMLEQARPYVEQAGETGTNRTGTPQNKKGTNKGRDEDTGNETG